MARHRAFVALEIADVVRERLAGLIDELRPRAESVGWVEPENLHLTLAFLGDVDELAVVPIARALTKACADIGPFRVSLSGLGCFPNPRRPKTLWVGVTEGADELQALYAAIVGPLEDTGWYRRDDRPFVPHLTLGRIRKDDEASIPIWPGLLKDHAEWDGGFFPCSELRVFRSELRKGSPEYIALATARLAGAGE